MTIRRYQWETEKGKDQWAFLNSIVKVYKTYTKGDLPELINFPSNGELTREKRADISRRWSLVVSFWRGS